MRVLRTRPKLEAFQSRQIRQFLHGPVAGVAAYAGSKFTTLGEAPVIDKAAMMSNFERYNALGLTAGEGWAIFDGNVPAPADYSVGASTGTSGNRGLYVVSAHERFVWLGVMLSRTLPNILIRSERVAVMLPQASRLYDAANESRQLTLRFFDLGAGIDRLILPVASFAPSIIVAPPRVLRALAESDISLSPEHIFSGGEVLDELDRAIIEARFGRRVKQIYMATEGLFAVSCDAGSLHLIEDHVAFETLPVEGSDGHFNPVITDFSRRTQIMLRYRMNDVLTFATGSCPCGSPHRALASISGRLDDSFRLTGAAGGSVLVTPDVIRNAVVGSDRGIDDFRVIQLAADRVLVKLKAEHAAQVAGACEALAAVLSRAGARASVSGETGQLQEPGARKLRRVQVAFDQAGP